MKQEIEKIFRAEADAIRDIPVSGEYEKVIELIYRSVHQNNGKVIASGMGKAGEIANNIATTFSSTGTPAVFLHPSDAQHGDLGIIQKNDVLLVISNSGKTREILELVELARNLHPRLPYVVITGNPAGELCKQSEAVIDTGRPAEVCILGLAPTTSTTVMTVIGDALVVLMEKKIGFTHEEYNKRHHGGYLGQKSRKAIKH